MDGETWGTSYQCIWEPAFSPTTSRVVAPVRVKGKWGMAQDNTMIWDPVFFNCWHQQFSADGSTLYALVSTAYGKWTVAKDGKPWGTLIDGFANDLSVSPDGSRAACVGRYDQGKYTILADDSLWTGGYEMAWQPVISPDSKHIAAKVEKTGHKFTLLVNGREYKQAFDELWDPIFSPDSNFVLLRAIDNGTYCRIVVPVGEL